MSKVIAKLGGDSRAVGILGGESGRTLEKLLENENFTTQFRFVEGPVSYTHLDVYKRQTHYCENLLEVSGLFALGERYRALEAPVSYTHLDVYKRQARLLYRGGNYEKNMFSSCCSAADRTALRLYGPAAERSLTAGAQSRCV